MATKDFRGKEIIVSITDPAAEPAAKKKRRGFIPPPSRPGEPLSRRTVAGLGVRIFDLAFRLIGDEYETQYFDTPVIGTSFPFPADTYLDSVITPLLASLPASPMRDHFYQIPKSEMSMRTDNTHWPYYGLVAFRFPEADCNLNEFPTVNDAGVISLTQDAGNVNGELEISSTWWILLPEYPFGTEQPPGWDNTLVTGYGLAMFIPSGVFLFPSYRVTATPDYNGPPATIPPITETQEIDVFFPPWLHAFETSPGVYDLKIVPRETWLDPDTIPDPDLIGSLPFNTILICILEGWNGQRFYIWDEDGEGF
jgi:hypothetical protein